MRTALAPRGTSHSARLLRWPWFPGLALTAASLWAAPLAAQHGLAVTGPTELPDPGTRVRVFAAPPSPEVVSGPLVAADAATLSLLDDGRAEVVQIPLSLVERLEVSRGRTSSAVRGLLIGAAVGAVPGAMMGLAVRGGDDNMFDNYPAVATVAAGAVMVGAVGGLVGVLIGATSTHERWRPVEWSAGARSAEASGASAGSGGTLLALTLRF